MNTAIKMKTMETGSRIEELSEIVKRVMIVSGGGARIASIR